jgi:PPOX class probable F420-dependent enzyme
MLGHHESDVGEVEDLAVLGPDARGAGEPCPAVLAAHGHMGDDLIRLDDLGQVLALRAGLLSRLALAAARRSAREVRCLFPARTCTHSGVHRFSGAQAESGSPRIRSIPDPAHVEKDVRATPPALPRKERVVSDILSATPESHRHLLEATLTATLTTIDVEGRPRSAAVWYFVDSDGQLKSSTHSDLEQYKDLSRNPNCSLLIIDFGDPFYTLEVRATAELTVDPDNSTVRKLADKYGLDAAKATVRENRLTVTYHPRQLLARRFWAEDVLYGQDADEQ